jgi:hypothetical protein
VRDKERRVRLRPRARCQRSCVWRRAVHWEDRPRGVEVGLIVETSRDRSPASVPVGGLERESKAVDQRQRHGGAGWRRARESNPNFQFAYSYMQRLWETAHSTSRDGWSWLVLLGASGLQRRPRRALPSHVGSRPQHGNSFVRCLVARLTSDSSLRPA